MKSLYKYSIFYAVVFVCSFISLYCGNKNDNSVQKDLDFKNSEFKWKDNISENDIPDFPVKAVIQGKDLSFNYINFEIWRGSNDNVINFSVNKPQQNCGFIENFEGVSLTKKSENFNQGVTLKSRFQDDQPNLSASYKIGENSSSSEWNFVLNIQSISDKTVTGKILIFFNDESKSWIGGKFEAIICKN